MVDGVASIGSEKKVDPLEAAQEKLRVAIAAVAPHDDCESQTHLDVLKADRELRELKGKQPVVAL